MNKCITEEEHAALVILKSCGDSVLDMAMLAKEAMSAARGRIRRARQCIEEGAKELKKQEQTVTFEKAVEAALTARVERRKRTVYDFRYFTRRFILRCKGLSKRRVRAITPQECAEYIETAFDTPRQRQKARLILSGVFGTALKRGWCNNNPVTQVEVPRVVEKAVPILTPQEIKNINSTAEAYQGGNCAAAVGMMLYAGIRPHEVSRLTWAEVDLKSKAIYINPRHSKTGGARRITIHAPLLHILKQKRQADSHTICPPGWLTHWRKLRQQAGWNSPNHPWPQDALRHTFASYHLSYFRNYAELQLEIGHRDASLLRTRYVDQRGVVNADYFWSRETKTKTPYRSPSPKSAYLRT